MQEIIQSAAALLMAAGAESAKIGLILGSGLGDYAETLDNPRFVNYADIPGYPVSHVAGHKSRFVVGEKAGKTVVAMQGRFHFYEGIPQSLLALGVRTMRAVGVETVLITNAAGGVNMNFHPGSLMLISDHINYSGSNPLIGPNDDAWGPRFPDQSDTYSRALRIRLREMAAAEGIELEEGVYMMFSGPCFETPAEVRMARIVGADAVGMSTVPEAIVAAHCGMRVLGISLITNMAAGILDQKLSHDEVNETAAIARERFTRLVDLILEQLL
ncbi:MAG: purine-nucleoside phosphorylase [Clostridiales bacterium]|nr:purine-nucleoside phosphorylase [Clostridiales bacterium]